MEVRRVKTSSSPDPGGAKKVGETLISLGPVRQRLVGSPQMKTGHRQP